MEYKAPDVTALANAIEAVQVPFNKLGNPPEDNPHEYDSLIGAYEDWE